MTTLTTARRSLLPETAREIPWRDVPAVLAATDDEALAEAKAEKDPIRRITLIADALVPAERALERWRAHRDAVGVTMLAHGVRPVDIMSDLGVHRTTVARWKDRMAEEFDMVEDVDVEAEKIRHTMPALEERVRTWLPLRDDAIFRLDKYGTRITGLQIGRLLGVSKVRIVQIRNGGVSKPRKPKG